MNLYQEMKDRQAKEVHAFPFGFAYNDQQFTEMMEKWGLDPRGDLNKIASVFGGGFVRKQDIPAMHEMFDRHRAEMQAAVDADTTGEGFVCDMFICEMENHEYSYTGDPEDTLRALGLTAEAVTQNKPLSHGFLLAHQRVMKEQ